MNIVYPSVSMRQRLLLLQDVVHLKQLFQSIRVNVQEGVEWFNGITVFCCILLALVIKGLECPC